MAEHEEDARLAQLRAEAEQEMRRRLPPPDGGRAAKRHKAGGEGAPAAANGGRFDYGAPKDLDSGAFVGFLLTCPIQRENSARKEAGALLARCLQRCQPGGGGGSTAVPDSAADAATTSAAGSEGAAPEQPEQQQQDEQEQQPEAQEQQEQQQAAPHQGLASVKLACRGVVLLKLAAQGGPAATTDSGGASGSGGDTPAFGAAGAGLVHQAVAALLGDIASGAQGRLAHVQRIVPVQATCRLEEGALRGAGAQLAALVAQAVGADAAAAAGDTAGGQPRALTFGIALKQREGPAAKPAAGAAAAGAAEAGAAESAPAEGGAAAAPATVAPASLPDRGAIIRSLAAGFEEALRQGHGVAASVDLKAPDWVLVAEVLPAGGQAFAALCALPRALCTLKPKLHVLPVGKAGV